MRVLFRRSTDCRERLLEEEPEYSENLLFQRSVPISTPPFGSRSSGLVPLDQIASPARQGHRTLRLVGTL